MERIFRLAPQICLRSKGHASFKPVVNTDWFPDHLHIVQALVGDL